MIHAIMDRNMQYKLLLSWFGYYYYYYYNYYIGRLLVKTPIRRCSILLVLLLTLGRRRRSSRSSSPSLFGIEVVTHSTAIPVGVLHYITPAAKG